MPEIVAPAPIDNQYLTVRYEKFAPLLIQGIKELRKELKALRNDINQLKDEKWLQYNYYNKYVLKQNQVF